MENPPSTGKNPRKSSTRHPWRRSSSAASAVCRWAILHAPTGPRFPPLRPGNHQEKPGETMDATRKKMEKSWWLKIVEDGSEKKLKFYKRTMLGINGGFTNGFTHPKLKHQRYVGSF